MSAPEETTLTEVIERLRAGTFYADYDWAAGPAMRALTFAAEMEARVLAVAAIRPEPPASPNTVERW